MSSIHFSIIYYISYMDFFKLYVQLKDDYGSKISN